MALFFKTTGDATILNFHKENTMESKGKVLMEIFLSNDPQSIKLLHTQIVRRDRHSV